jgi:hypothetical protein
VKVDRLSSLGLVAWLCAAVGCAAEGPEPLCERWVTASCDAFLGCCAAGERFDGRRCREELWGACLDALQADAVRDGAADFDRAAAEACLAPLDVCALDAPLSEAQVLACHDAAAGHRGPGEACTRPGDCQRPDAGHAVCYGGVLDNGPGVCAKVVTSTGGTCGFAADTHIRSICPADQLCDVSGLVPPAGGGTKDAPIYEFSADCKPLLLAGQPCSAQIGHVAVELPCAAGLHCGPDPSDPKTSICLPRKARGEACEAYRGECATGLGCWGEPSICRGSAMVAPFCYAPPACGDHLCEPPETLESCGIDCALCGDGLCSPGESWAECSSDCPHCGDGYCDAPESPETCRGDCPLCGDGSCDLGESFEGCPADCPF